MSDEKKAPVLIQKVSPFPIPVNIHRGKPEPSKGRIRSMNIHGFMMEADYEYYRIGEVLSVNFELPAFKYKIETKVRVMRTQQPIEHTRKGDLATRLTVEMHFYKLKPEDRDTIRKFLDKIAAKPTAA